MMSQTHVLLAAALLAKPQKPLRNSAVLAGALAPDAGLLALFGWSKWTELPAQPARNGPQETALWGDWIAASNSAIVYGTVLLLGLVILRAAPAAFRIGLFLTLFALAAFTNLASDLPFHLAETGRYLWPLDQTTPPFPAFHTLPACSGTLHRWPEAGLGLVLAIVLWRRFRSIWMRMALAVLLAVYLALPAYCVLVSGEPL